MSLLREEELPYVQQLAINVLKMGIIPNHIAIVMDGNRRFAQNNNLKKTEGHSMGFTKLSEVLQWCQNLGVKELTVYAFSIDNFKRTQEEVNCLTSLASNRFQRIVEDVEKFKQQGVNVRVVGNLSLLPLYLQVIMTSAVNATRENTRIRLNIAFSYTSRDEIVEATKGVVEGVARNEIEEDDITTTLLEGAMYSEGSLPVDLLIRTSGEVRLSDFMLWQASHSVIHFSPILWPEYSFWNFMWAIFQYQRNKSLVPSPQQQSLSPAATKYLDNLRSSRLASQSSLLQGSC